MQNPAGARFCQDCDDGHQ
ncbi:MAG: hypothetical protein K2N06_12080 [Oscillospiraceae bacterium]|nr:hypothetical protein [Oscillospiraceae bacterium]